MDKAAIQAYLDELGFDADTNAVLLAQLEKDDAKAQKFVGQRLRHDDYTKKTQALAQERAAIEQKVTQQVSAYATQLTEAQGKIDRIMRDFEQAKVSQATADARLQRVKEQFGLSDEDVPPVASVAAAKVEPQMDIDAKLQEMRQQLTSDVMKQLMPELMAFPRISAQQQEMARRHVALTGKDLSFEDMKSLLESAEKERKPLVDVWDTKYGIAGLEKENEFQGRLKAEKQKWDDEQKRLASEAAIATATGKSYDGSKPLTTSPVVGRDFKQHTDPASGNGGTGKSVPAAPAEKKPGWQRAAERWVSDRAKGIPVGAPASARQ